MSESHRPDQPDEPWNDTPSDDEAEVLAMEPNPAEVVDAERGIDVSEPSNLRPTPADEYDRETLDERLREEEPDPALGAEPGYAGDGEAAAGMRVAEPADLGGADVTKEEIAGPVDTVEGDLSAEEEAVHVEPEE